MTDKINIKCDKCGYEWPTSPNARGKDIRRKYASCPMCKGSNIIPEGDDEDDA